MRKILLVAGFMWISGCASVPTHQAALVREVPQDAVEGCDFLGAVKGMSGWGGVAASGTGRNNAVVSAKEKAAALGATHMVWVAQGDAIQTAAAHAYLCEG